MRGDGPTWTDIVGAIGGIVGLGVGGASAVIAGLAKRDSRRSADAAEKSASEAAKLSAIEQERRDEERERRHEDLWPHPPEKIETELREGGATRSLFGSVMVTRTYRVRAEALRENGGSAPLSLPMVLRPYRKVSFEIEKWPDGKTKPQTKEIKVLFWPPVEGDDADVWTCKCDRSTGESLDGDGHWKWVVKVADPPAEPWAMWGD